MTREEAYEFIQLYKKFVDETTVRIDDFPIDGVVEIWVRGERVRRTEWQAAKIISAESSEEA
jgi:hypothetical protein